MLRDVTKAIRWAKFKRAAKWLLKSFLKMLSKPRYIDRYTVVSGNIKYKIKSKHHNKCLYIYIDTKEIKLESIYGNKNTFVYISLIIKSLNAIQILLHRNSFQLLLSQK